MANDVYQRITDKIVTDLEKGVRPWFKPWSTEHLSGRVTRPLRHNGTPYNGINILSLWLQAIACGYAAPIWMTFKQALELGACVRKGEKGSPVVYANKLTRTETDKESGDETTRQIAYLKGYTVFNVEQIDGLPDHYYGKPKPLPVTFNRIEHAEAYFRNVGANIRHGGPQAFYAVSTDHIQMPPFECFRDPESYYATLAHECTHWTKHEKRLARDFGRKRWGDDGYAMEELVAELGAAFLAADLNLTPEPREEHSSYLAHWLGVLKRDSRAIFAAAAHAQRAADFLNDLQPKPATDEARAA